MPARARSRARRAQARTHGPGEARLDGRDVLRQVVAVQAQPRLQAQAVARAQACRGVRRSVSARAMEQSVRLRTGNAPARCVHPAAMIFSVSSTARSFGTLISKPSSPV